MLAFCARHCFSIATTHVARMVTVCAYHSLQSELCLVRAQVGAEVVVQQCIITNNAVKAAREQTEKREDTQRTWKRLGR